MMAISRLCAEAALSDDEYEQLIQPVWWARLQTGWLEIPLIQANKPLDERVDVPPGTQVLVGYGPLGCRVGVATVTTVRLGE
jgi:hypothetical protein